MDCELFGAGVNSSKAFAPMSTAKPEMEFASVSKSYRLSGKGLLRSGRAAIETEALNNVSFQISKGETVGLVGRNGAGKSTLLRLACGVLSPDSGKIRLLGRDPAKEQPAVLGRLGFVIGARSRLIWDLPTRDSFDLHQAIYGLKRSRFRRRLDELEEDLGLQGLFDRTVRELSLGQRMRADIALALLHEPEVLLLDEATIALDSATKQRFRKTLERAGKRLGTTIVLASNDLEDVRTMCQRVLVLSGQTLIYDGNIRDLYLQPAMPERFTVTVNSAEDVDSVVNDFLREGFPAPRIKRTDLAIIFPVSVENERVRMINHASGMIGRTLRKFEWGRPSLEEIIDKIG